MPIILQHGHPSWAEDHNQWRIIGHLRDRIGNQRVRQVDIVTAWMGGPQLLDRLRPALMSVIERHTEARPTRIRIVVGNQPAGSRMTPESTFERLLQLDENYENVECYVHAAPNNRLFHTKYYAVTSRVAGRNRVDLMIGSANATGFGIGLSSHPNIEVVAWGELTQADDIQNLSEITQYLCDGPNAIRLNSNEGREFVESYEGDPYHGGGGHGGQVNPLEPPVQPEPPEEQGILEFNQEELMDLLDNLVTDSNHDANGTAVEYLAHIRQGGGANQAGHYYRHAALATQFVIDTQPIELMQLIRENTQQNMNWYGRNNLMPGYSIVREQFSDWLGNEDNWDTPIYKVLTYTDGEGNNIHTTVNDQRGNIARNWNGSQNTLGQTSPFCVVPALYIIAWEIWDPEVNPAA
tara:strand:- start:1081 stop:2304 length:1224 start_codon:yes stop_codon:yes gene_type:complete